MVRGKAIVNERARFSVLMIAACCGRLISIVSDGCRYGLEADIAAD